MKKRALLVALCLALCLPACYVPKKWVVGVYYADTGDTLRINPNYAFRVEMLNPDSASQQQLKFTSGRWYKKRNKLHLTVAAKVMGEYWQCVPLMVGWRHLRRPADCNGGGPTIDFRKVHFKKLRKRPETEKEDKKNKKRSREEPE
jgi:hypothetical protein